MKKKITINENKKSVWFILTAMLFLGFFIINYFTPKLADDYAYSGHYIYWTDQKITGISTMWQSIHNFYFDWGGRVLGYFFAALFSFLPKTVFAAVNTVAYLVTTVLIYLLCKNNEKNSLLLFILIHVLLWFSVPDYGQVMFWLCGSANYMWASIFIFGMLLLYRVYAKKEGNAFRNPLWAVPFAVLGFLAGIAMENMSAGMLVVMTCYLYRFIRKGYGIKLPLISSYASAVIGFALLILAPGNAMRTQLEQTEKLSFAFRFASINYYWFTFMGGLSILWIILKIAKCKKDWNTIRKEKKIGLKKKIEQKKTVFFLLDQLEESDYYAIASVLSAYCMVAASSSPERTWYIVCAFLILSIGMMMQEIDWSRFPLADIIWKIGTFGGLLLMFVAMADTMLYSREVKQQLQAREQYIEEQKANGVMDITVPVVTHKYPFKSHHDALSGLSDITSDNDFWINKDVAKYYGVTSIVGTGETLEQ